MSGFSLDFNNTFEGYEDIKDGTYEVIIDQVGEDAAKTGTEFVNFRMAIRNDIDQPHQNQKMWHRVWKSKQTNQYSPVMFNTIGKAAQLQNGKTYNSLDELLQDFQGKPVQVTVKNETSEHNGQTYENLNVKSWRNTAYPNVQHQFKGDNNAPTNNVQQDSTTLNDSDFPF